MKTKTLVDFHICISAPLSFKQQSFFNRLYLDIWCWHHLGLKITLHTLSDREVLLIHPPSQIWTHATSIGGTYIYHLHLCFFDDFMSLPLMQPNIIQRKVCFVRRIRKGKSLASFKWLQPYVTKQSFVWILMSLRWFKSNVLPH